MSQYKLEVWDGAGGGMLLFSHLVHWQPTVMQTIKYTRTNINNGLFKNLNIMEYIQGQRFIYKWEAIFEEVPLLLLSILDEKVSCGWPPWICQYNCDILLSVSVFSKGYLKELLNIVGILVLKKDFISFS